MKSIICSSLILLCTAFFALLIPTDAEAEIYDDTLRLHILANSDSEEDQKLKLAIRDKILEKYGKELSDEVSIASATEKAKKLLSNIEADTESWIRELGYDYTAEVSLEKEWYDTREYDSFTLPKGTYTSLKVMIGDAGGKNWWCVMYPPLCMSIATENAPYDDAVLDYSKEEVNLIKGGKYKIKFKILEIISSAFTKNG